MNTQNKRPLILVTNDDGYDAKGIASLVEAVKDLGKVVVVAPDGPRSGQSSAITPGVPLRAVQLKKNENLEIFKTTGTPVDCVKLALHQLLESKPDIVLSGINHGSNAAVSVIYSGTMGAAIEGCIAGINSIGFSLCSYDKDADFSNIVDYIRFIVKDVIDNGLEKGVCLNVNFPDSADIKGVRVCRQASGFWTKEFEKRKDPIGKDYYWLTGYFHNNEPQAKDTDEWALSNGFASVVPCKVDMTSYETQGRLKTLESFSKEG
ncbi:MAG: 5'/3'-nucleotidase SurE [Bacteroidales bacterium]|nr:5'/3'-nucleotidase SurE [Bacteroidales bacterium]